MASTKRRARTKHSGVKVKRRVLPSGTVSWRAIWIDPDSKKQTYLTLDPLVLGSAEARREWAIRKARDIAKRRMELESGATPIARSALAEAVDGYYKAADHLRPRTLELYRVATAAFLEWARTRNIRSSAELRATDLPGFRDYLLAQRKQSYVSGGRRGERTAGKQKLSPLTVNWKLRAVKTVLNHLRMRGFVPLSSDQIADALKPAAVPREQADFLKPNECRQLLEAALRHDAATFAATREEHAQRRGDRETREKPVNETARYEPIAPFVACVLLSGMRLGEALALRWLSVDLEALNADDRVVGEIRLKADETKTHHARTISLEVSPTLRELLARLKLRAGKAEFVFGGNAPMSRMLAAAAARRLTGAPTIKPTKAGKDKGKERKTQIGGFGAPEQFTWQVLRSTCATYQCNSPSLFGAAAAFVSAKRLGHSVSVSEKHYAGLFAVSRDARTLEAAMGIEDLMQRVIAAVAQPLRAAV